MRNTYSNFLLANLSVHRDSKLCCPYQNRDKELWKCSALRSYLGNFLMKGSGNFHRFSSKHLKTPALFCTMFSLVLQNAWQKQLKSSLQIGVSALSPLRANCIFLLPGYEHARIPWRTILMLKYWEMQSGVSKDLWIDVSRKQERLEMRLKQHLWFNLVILAYY